MPMADPVIELDNAISTAKLLADELGEAPPTIQGRYELRRTLGRGAHGLVCEAQDHQLARAVALKLMPLQGPRSAEYAVREARTLAQFDHPNIVRIFDVGQSSEVAGYKVDLVYVVMELLRGTNLRTWAAASPPLSAVRDVFLAAGEGLAAAHERGFVHGDFKPENVVIDERGHVRVVDFGLARFGGGELTGGLGFAVAATMTQGPRGTPGYIAPEVYTSRIDARSDQYSYAISFREIATGRTPGERADLPPALARLLARASAQEPSSRFASMRELLAELRGLELDAPAAMVPSPPRPLWAHPAVLFFAGTAIFLGVAAYLSQGDPPGPSAALASSSTAPSPSSSPTARDPAPTRTPSASSQPSSGAASERSPASTAPADVSPACPELAPIFGEWSFTTVVQWAAEAKMDDARGFYWLEVLPARGCEAVFLVRKHGDSGLPTYKNLWQDRVVVAPTIGADGTVAVTLDTWLGKNRALDGTDPAREGLHYGYSLKWRGGALSGAWQMVDESASPIMRGSLEGVRRTPRG